MTDPTSNGAGALLEGIKVVEVAMWAFVPSAGAVLAEWGADVLKIEHPKHGDPLRGLTTSGFRPGTSGVAFMWEIHNRGKRSVALDLAHPDGREALYRLVDGADVFLTSLLPAARRTMLIDEEHIQGRNPSIIYARGSGAGPAGPEAERGGFDSASFWGRSGLAAALGRPGDDEAVPMPAPAYGDLTSGLALAGAVAAALVRRARTGAGAVIDVSLLHTAMWSMSAEISGANLLGTPKFYRGDRASTANPLTASYRTRDGRFIQLVMLDADRHWPDLCRRLGRDDLVADERYGDQRNRAKNARACVAELVETFAGRDLAEWKERLDGMSGVWAVVQDAIEVTADPQVTANGYAPARTTASGDGLVVVPNPVQVDGRSPVPGPAPEHGADTELALVEAGFSWDDIIRLKDSGALP